MSTERKNYYHRIRVTSTQDSIDADNAALVVKGGASINGSLLLGGQLNTTSGLSVGSTTPSTSFTTGALVLVGGLAINNTTDATSYSSGGGLSIAGGAVIGKSLLTTGTIATRTGLVLSTAPASSTGGTLTWAMAGQSSILANTDPSTYSMLVNTSDQLELKSINASSLSRTHLRLDYASTTPLSIKSKQSTTMVAITPNREDRIAEQIFTSTTDVVSTASDVTNFVFTTSRGFVALVHVLVDATTPVSCMYELRGVRNGADMWEMSQDSFLGDIVSITFSIVPATGQVQFIKSTTAGHVNTTFAWRVTSLFDNP